MKLEVTEESSWRCWGEWKRKRFSVVDLQKRTTASKQLPWLNNLTFVVPTAMKMIDEEEVVNEENYCGMQKTVREDFVKDWRRSITTTKTERQRIVAVQLWRCVVMDCVTGVTWRGESRDYSTCKCKKLVSASHSHSSFLIWSHHYIWNLKELGWPWK